MNNQQLKFIEGMFLSKESQVQPIRISVTDKHEGIKFSLDVVAAGWGVAYKVNTSAGESLWNSWDDIDEVKNSFRMMSLI